MSHNQTRGRPSGLHRSEQPNLGLRRRRALTTLGILGGLCAMVGIVFAVAGGGHPATSATTSPRPHVEPTVMPTSPARGPSSSPASSPPAGSLSAKRPGAAASLPVILHTVATYSGSGNQTTPAFTTTSGWQLVYSFNCSEFGTPARAEVVEGDRVRLGKVLVNTKTLRADGRTRVTGDAGSHYLLVNSACSWVVKVVDLP